MFQSANDAAEHGVKCEVAVIVSAAAVKRIFTFYTKSRPCANFTVSTK